MNNINTLIASSYDSSGDATVGLAIVVAWLVFWIGVGGGVGYLIGNSKGRGTAGFWLGVVLGLIGWIIAACLSPSYEVQVQRAEMFERTRRAARGNLDMPPPPPGR